MLQAPVVSRNFKFAFSRALENVVAYIVSDMSFSSVFRLFFRLWSQISAKNKSAVSFVFVVWILNPQGTGATSLRNASF